VHQMNRQVPIYHLYGEDGLTPADFWLHCETIPSRSQLHHYDISLHRHEHLSQMLFVSSGEADAIINDRTIKVTPPSLILVPAGFDHGFRFSRDIDGLVITMLSSHANLMQHELSTGPVVLPLDYPLPSGELISTLLQTIGSEAAENQFGRSEVLAASLSMVMLLALRAVKTEQGAGSEVSDTSRMEQLTALMRQHLRKEHGATFYAQKLGISPTHLNRLCQQQFGQTTRDYIANMLIAEIKRDLIFTNDAIQNLSFRFGFSDPTYFSRFFMRSVKMPPKRWREHERQNPQKQV
jgi:AraC family transcriptional activator of pobA